MHNPPFIIDLLAIAKRQYKIIVTKGEKTDGCFRKPATGSSLMWISASRLKIDFVCLTIGCSFKLTLVNSKFLA
jgi:hypothetical protein